MIESLGELDDNDDNKVDNVDDNNDDDDDDDDEKERGGRWQWLSPCENMMPHSAYHAMLKASSHIGYYEEEEEYDDDDEEKNHYLPLWVNPPRTRIKV